MKKQWWHDKVAYQIYPKSFMDSNNDGIGDIRGIISKLDYLQDLGIDIIWLSPIYKSPFVDQGYDIADYYKIDECFGTMQDMDELIKEAKKRNMHILMDLVINHCSDKHEWFLNAIKDPTSKYGDYFIIKNKDELNNWRSYFGGSVWDKLPNSEDKYYLHLFTKEQPDLNWNNKELVDEIYKNINWWLDRGIGGFRIDAIVNIKKDESYADLEVDGIDNLADARKMLSKASGLIDELHKLNEKTFKKYNAFTVAELFDYNKDDIEKYIGDAGCFSSIFDFSSELIGKSKKGWYDNKKVSPNEYRDTIFKSDKLSDGVGYMCNIIENHDEPRGASRFLNEYSDNLYAKKALATFFMLRRGLPFIYQGQEIGMTNARWNSIDEINDVHTIDQYNLAKKLGLNEEERLELVRTYSRDNARTPMQWSDDAYAGFSKQQPWLKLNDNYKVINVKSQINDENSLFNYYKALITLRKNEAYKDVIVYGKLQETMTDIDDLIAFYRRGDTVDLLILINFSNKEKYIHIKDNIKNVVLDNYNKKSSTNEILLQPFEAMILEI